MQKSNLSGSCLEHTAQVSNLPHNSLLICIFTTGYPSVMQGIKQALLNSLGY